MRYTIPILALALLFGAWIAPAHAQRRDGPPDPETRVERMTERMDLTEAQADQVREILREQAEVRQRIFADGRGPETREQMMELRERTHERLAQVLNDQQMQQMRQAARRARPDGRRTPMRGRPGTRRGCN